MVFLWGGILGARLFMLRKFPSIISGNLLTRHLSGPFTPGTESGVNIIKARNMTLWPAWQTVTTLDVNYVIISLSYSVYVKDLPWLSQVRELFQLKNVSVRYVCVNVAAECVRILKKIDGSSHALIGVKEMWRISWASESTLVRLIHCMLAKLMWVYLHVAFSLNRTIYAGAWTLTQNQFWLRMALSKWSFIHVWCYTLEMLQVRGFVWTSWWQWSTGSLWFGEGQLWPYKY